MGDPIQVSIELVDKMSAGLGSIVSQVGKLAAGALGAHDNIAMMRARLNALSGSTKAGGAVIKMLSDMRDETGMTRDELAPLAQKLLAIGTPLDQMHDKLKAVAAQQALGLGGDEAMIKVLAKLHAHVKISTKELGALERGSVRADLIAKEMGLSLSDLQKQLKGGTVDTKKFSDAMTKVAGAQGMEAAEAKAKSFDHAVDNLKESFADLFANVDTKPMIDELRSLAKEFGPGTKAGQELRKELGDAFTSIGKAVKTAAPLISDLLKGIPTWGPPAAAALVAIELAAAPMAAPFVLAAAAVIALKTALNELDEIQEANRKAGIEQEKTFLNNSLNDKKAASAMRSYIALRKSLIAADIREKGDVASGKMSASQYAASHAAAAKAIAQARQDAYDAKTTADAGPSGNVTGAVKASADKAIADADKAGAEAGAAYAAGIASAAGKAKAAGAAVAGAAQSGFDEKNERKSPPRAYTRRGHEAGKAFADGFEGSQSAMSSALGRAARVAGRAHAGSGSGGKVVHVHFGANAIVVNGASGAEDISEQVLSRAMERIALSRGLG